MGTGNTALTETTSFQQSPFSAKKWLSTCLMCPQAVIRNQWRRHRLTFHFLLQKHITISNDLLVANRMWYLLINKTEKIPKSLWTFIFLKNDNVLIRGRACEKNTFIFIWGSLHICSSLLHGTTNYDLLIKKSKCCHNLFGSNGNFWNNYLV